MVLQGRRHLSENRRGTSRVRPVRRPCTGRLPCWSACPLWSGCF